MPIAIKDIDIALKKYCADIGSMKGKTVRCCPDPVISDLVALPKEIICFYPHFTLAVDVMFVNRVPFLVCILEYITFTTAEFLPNKRSNTLTKALKNIVIIYNKRIFSIDVVYIDCAFELLKTSMDQPHINATAAKENVPLVEQHIHILKELVHAIKCMVTYRRFPEVMLIGCINFTVLWVNAFSSSKGASTRLSTHILVLGTTFNYHTHCCLSFGAYTMTHKGPDILNGDEERLILVISLGSDDNVHGS